jgi:HAMP domain-containing protein
MGLTITPELYELITKIVEDKIKGIRVTREEFEELRKAVNTLTDNVNRLTEAQRRTEERLTILTTRVTN